MLTSAADIKYTAPDNDPSLTVTAATLITTMLFVLLDNPNANSANQLCPVGSDFVVLVCGVFLWSKKKATLATLQQLNENLPEPNSLSVLCQP